MSLPNSSSLEMPILQELIAVGGADDVRFLYNRLTAYFPQLEAREIAEIQKGTNKHWRKAVQKAGKILDDDKLLDRKNGFWELTRKGFEAAQVETSGFTLTKPEIVQTSHVNIQEILIEIGNSLGFYAEMEFEYYDVVWRESEKSPRISHIFEVQSKGNLDSAFAKLKRAYHNQRTKPFLILSSEKDLNRARQSLAREFQDIESAVTILTFVQIKQIHRNLQPIGEVLVKFLKT